jgi:hypothetical protein
MWRCSISGTRFLRQGHEDGKAVAANVSTKTQLLNVHDGTFFFANDVLHSMSAAGQAEQSEAQAR